MQNPHDFVYFFRKKLYLRFSLTIIKNYVYSKRSTSNYIWHHRRFTVYITIWGTYCIRSLKKKKCFYLGYIKYLYLINNFHLKHNSKVFNTKY